MKTVVLMLQVPILTGLRCSGSGPQKELTDCIHVDAVSERDPGRGVAGLRGEAG